MFYELFKVSGSDRFGLGDIYVRYEKIGDPVYVSWPLDGRALSENMTSRTLAIWDARPEHANGFVRLKERYTSLEFPETLVQYLRINEDDIKDHEELMFQRARRLFREISGESG